MPWSAPWRRARSTSSSRLAGNFPIRYFCTRVRAVMAMTVDTRRRETGYVRQYGAIIGIGVVLLLGWFVVIRGIL